MEFSLAEVQAATGAYVSGTLPEVRVHGWSIDSRSVAPGDLYFAIKGEHFDGHAFVPAAFEQGAVGAVVSDRVSSGGLLLSVHDTVTALQQLAHWARRQWAKPVVAVTGSAGKTTTKDLIARLLGVRFQVGKTVGNFNNHIGLPLSLLRIPENADLGVIEIGMNHAGEIRSLATIAEPQIAVVTNVGYAHIEAFESIEGIALAKRELVESLPSTGTAVLNADDERVLAFRDTHPGRVVTYGFSSQADIRATDVELHKEGSEFCVRGVRFLSPLAGRHGVQNVLAALAVATLFEIPFQDLVEAVANFTPGKMRGERSEWRGITILNDSYNSNPEAARSMIDVLRNEPAQRRIAVLGEMLELGRWAEKLHGDLGVYVARAGIDVLVGIRGASSFMVESARNAGDMHGAAFFFDEPEAAGTFLRDFVRPGDAILFKGSRGSHVEKALATMEL
jgi:UDP-N-acetylmuramoyl-tripeptide--D-alanyl-D-alanine ligase